jgi:hypothetical protein
VGKRQAVPAIVKARQKFQEQQEQLNQIPVELQVKDMEHALSNEVVNFCISHLSAGGRWDELRRKLGLGHAHKDWRWRRLREVLANGLIPKSEEEALKAQADRRAFLVSKLEEFENDVEAVLQTYANKFGDGIALQNMLRLKLEVIKTQLAENEKEFNAYVSMKKVKSDDKKNRGPSIIIQQNFNIPRPGDKVEEIDVATRGAVKLAQAKVEVNE